MTQTIFLLYRLIIIIFPRVLEDDNNSKNNNNIQQNNNNRPRSLSEGDLSNNHIVNTIIHTSNIVRVSYAVNSETTANILIPRLETIRINLEEIRTKPINQRIIEVFMEIDLLGNYTESSWFLNLEKREYYKYYGTLYDIWGYRARIPYDVKKQICP